MRCSGGHIHGWRGRFGCHRWGHPVWVRQMSEVDRKRTHMTEEEGTGERGKQMRLYLISRKSVQKICHRFGIRYSRTYIFETPLGLFLVFINQAQVSSTSRPRVGSKFLSETQNGSARRLAEVWTTVPLVQVVSTHRVSCLLAEMFQKEISNGLFCADEITFHSCYFCHDVMRS